MHMYTLGDAPEQNTGLRNLMNEADGSAASIEYYLLTIK
jgi:hypothetical protein